MHTFSVTLFRTDRRRRSPYKLHAVSSREDFNSHRADSSCTLYPREKIGNTNQMKKNIRGTHKTRKTDGEVGRLGTLRCGVTPRRETHIRTQKNKPDFASCNWDRLSSCWCLRCRCKSQDIALICSQSISWCISRWRHMFRILASRLL